jgi:hypothetical protein
VSKESTISLRWVLAHYGSFGTFGREAWATGVTWNPRALIVSRADAEPGVQHEELPSCFRCERQTHDATRTIKADPHIGGDLPHVT